MNYDARRKALLEAAARAEADAVLLTFLPDIRWACGFTGSNGLLFVGQVNTWFLTDGRYAAQVQREVTTARTEIVTGDLIAGLATLGAVSKGVRVAIQAEHVTLSQRRTLEGSIPEAALVETEGLLPPLVAVKTPEEVTRIQAAQRLTEDVFEDLIDIIRPGVTEK
ncbi:MAG TPA: aminopeptidase P family N-terminal domain-containing protein, partial [Rhodothermales bacterium]|nr:aminopeptidase P family N-terminal domain-containing protein [Rhodothermales bacterium]